MNSQERLKRIHVTMEGAFSFGFTLTSVAELKRLYDDIQNGIKRFERLRDDVFQSLPPLPRTQFSRSRGIRSYPLDQSTDMPTPPLPPLDHGRRPTMITCGGWRSRDSAQQRSIFAAPVGDSHRTTAAVTRGRAVWRCRRTRKDAGTRTAAGFSLICAGDNYRREYSQEFGAVLLSIQNLGRGYRSHACEMC
jgi:hypothetical protein